MGKKRKSTSIALALATAGLGVAYMALPKKSAPHSDVNKAFRLDTPSFNTMQKSDKELAMPGQAAPSVSKSEADIYLPLDPVSVSSGLQRLDIRYMPMQGVLENGRVTGMAFAMFEHNEKGEVVRTRFGVNHIGSQSMHWDGVQYSPEIAVQIKDMKTQTLLSQQDGVDRLMLDNGKENGKQIGLRDQKSGAITALSVPTAEDLAAYEQIPADRKNHKFQNANDYLSATQQAPLMVLDTVYEIAQKSKDVRIFVLSQNADKVQNVLRIDVDGKVELGKVELLKRNLYTPIGKPTQDHMDTLRFNMKSWQSNYTRQSMAPLMPVHFAQMFAAHRTRNA